MALWVQEDVQTQSPCLKPFREYVEVSQALTHSTRLFAALKLVHPLWPVLQPCSTICQPWPKRPCSNVGDVAAHGKVDTEATSSRPQYMTREGLSAEVLWWAKSCTRVCIADGGPPAVGPPGENLG